MEAICHLKYQRYGRRKIAQLLDAIKGKTLYEAGHILANTPRGANTVVSKAVMSAGANLSVKLGKKLDLKQAWVCAAYADKGPMKMLHRVQPGPQGRAMPFVRKMCHITVKVSDSKEAKR